MSELLKPQCFNYKNNMGITVISNLTEFANSAVWFDYKAMNKFVYSFNRLDLNEASSVFDEFFEKVCGKHLHFKETLLGVKVGHIEDFDKIKVFTPYIKSSMMFDILTFIHNIGLCYEEDFGIEKTWTLYGQNGESWTIETPNYIPSFGKDSL